MKELTQIGFKVLITINCETEEEILTHLSVIRKEVKKIAKKGIPNGLDVEFNDDNCYGTHEVRIEPDLY